MKVNQTTAWACASGRIIMPWSVRSTRKEVVQEMEKSWGRPWAKLKQQGNTVLKIAMTPIEDKKE